VGERLDILIVGEGLVPLERIDAELRRSGLEYVLSVAPSEPEMLNTCRLKPPDVVVALDSDETFDAVAILALTRELCSQAPLIVVANAASEEVVVEALRSGVTDYVIADRLSRLGPALGRAVAESAATKERLAAKQAVREAEARFRAVFENAPLGISIRTDDRVLAVNDEYLHMFGYADVSDVPVDVRDHDIPESRETITEHLTEAARLPHAYEGTAQRQDGSTFPYEVRSAPMTVGDEDALVSFVADITVRRQSEEELDRYRRDLERMVRERTDELMAANRRLQEATETRIRFLSSMSHELRTPLNSIIGFSGVLLQGLSGALTDDQRHQIEIISQAGHRLMDTIEDVLDVSRIEAGKAEPEWEQFELDTVMKALVDTMREGADAKGLAFEVRMPEQPTAIVSDRRKLSQVVHGLLENAIKFTNQGSIGLVVERRGGDTVWVRVRDTGSGIAPEELPSVFEEFRQVRNPDGTRPEGAGLGLSICSKLATLLGGSLKATSQIGRGSEFVLILPVGPVVDLGGGQR
jgi:PAS domain S-box-containing protein